MEASRLADTSRALRHMFIRDLVLPASIGVHAHERAAKQRVRINLDLAIDDAGGDGRDDFAHVVDYETLIRDVRAEIAARHVRLVETMAERLAAICLTDSRVVLARVRVEKLDIFPDACSAGVEIERRR